MKLTKNVILSGAVATTVVAGTITFNTDLVEKVKGNINTLATQLEKFVQNDKDLVAKYEELHKEATGKISNLEKEAQDAAEEISKLEAEVTKANAAITELKTLSDEVVKDFENINPKNPDELPGLDDEIVEEEPIAIATATAHFYQNRIHVTITLNDDINIGVLRSGNVKIEYLDANGEKVKLQNKAWAVKDKNWAGYLNDSNGNQYGKGLENNGTYSNELSAGNTYSTTLAIKEGEVGQETIDAISQVRITVTKDKNVSTTITINK